jgi:photosystem II stability/assembly factor-like uncharacterized protein
LGSGIVFAGTRSGVFKSNDGGASWSAASSGLPALYVLGLAIDPHSPTTVYAGTFGGGVFMSSDGGATWTDVSEGLTSPFVNALAIDAVTPTTLYAGTNDGVFSRGSPRQPFTLTVDKMDESDVTVSSTRRVR